MTHPDPHASVRIGDHDRARAMEQLGQHFAAGRLTVTEYDQRCAEASKALIHDDLARLFTDLPNVNGAVDLPSNKDLLPKGDGPYYSATEIQQAYHQGRKPRSAVMLLTTIGSIAGSIVLSPIWAASATLLFLIPAVAVLLYVLKIGPKSWHRPSQRELDRQRARQQRQRHRAEIQERKAKRQLQVEDLKTNAVDYARKFMGGTDR